MYKDLLMILSWDIQLLSNLAKNLRMTPNLCGVDQIVSVLICKMEMLPTDTTDPSEQSSVFIGAAWQRSGGEGSCQPLRPAPPCAFGQAGPHDTRAHWPETLCWGWYRRTSRLVPFWVSMEVREAQGP